MAWARQKRQRLYHVCQGASGQRLPLSPHLAQSAVGRVEWSSFSIFPACCNRHREIGSGKGGL